MMTVAFQEHLSVHKEQGRVFSRGPGLMGELLPQEGEAC